MKNSEFKVLKSNAGYYIGTTYAENVGDSLNPIYINFPYERLSGYFLTEDEASQSLINFKSK
jgi:hypothetical protein